MRKRYRARKVESQSERERARERKKREIEGEGGWRYEEGIGVEHPLHLFMKVCMQLKKLVVANNYGFGHDGHPINEFHSSWLRASITLCMPTL